MSEIRVSEACKKKSCATHRALLSNFLINLIIKDEKLENVAGIQQVFQILIMKPITTRP